MEIFTDTEKQVCTWGGRPRGKPYFLTIGTLGEAGTAVRFSSNLIRELGLPEYVRFGFEGKRVFVMVAEPDEEGAMSLCRYPLNVGAEAARVHAIHRRSLKMALIDRGWTYGERIYMEPITSTMWGSV